MTSRTIRFVLMASLLLTATIIADSPKLEPIFTLWEISSVKNQQGGTCWTHGTMAAIESNLMVTGEWTNVGDTGEPNLAEYHLDWWNGFNEYFNQDMDPPSGNQGLEIHYGGDYHVATAYLSRGEGAVREIDGQSFDDPPLRYDSSYHRYYPRDVVWLSAGLDLSRINEVKQALMDHGAVATCMCCEWDDNSMMLFYDPTDHTFYQPPEDGRQPTHAIAIVGWNDYLETGAPLPGAWKCKNSWGTGFGQGGYFYASYYDKYVGKHAEMGAVSFQNVTLFDYDTVYYHDYHGWRDELDNCMEAFNVYRSRGGETVRSVSFITVEDSVEYTFRIYDLFEHGVLEAPLYEQSGYIGHKGFHTIDLTTPIRVSDHGNDFYLYLQVSRGGQAFDRSREVPVLLGSKSLPKIPSTSLPGQSFYFEDGEWKDLYFENATANFCLKALSDFDIWFDNTSHIGVVPLSVDFSGWTKQSADTLVWRFGDSDTAFGPSASHTYTEGGKYTVTLEAIVGGKSYTVSKPGEFIALADTVSAGEQTGTAGQSIAVSVSGFNTCEVGRIMLPIELAGDFVPIFDSISTSGCRAECLDAYEVVHFDSWYNRFTVSVHCSDPDSNRMAPAGDGELLRVYFHSPIDVPDGAQASIIIDGYPAHPLAFCTAELDYPVTGLAGQLTVLQCCLGFRGNVDGDAGNVVDIADLVYFVDYSFGSPAGPDPECMAEADLDASGAVDIGDLVYLVEYMFSDGPAPLPCPGE